MVSCGEELNNMIASLRKRIYWEPTERVLHKKIEQLINEHNISKKEATVRVLDHLKGVMVESKNEVEEIIQKRFEEKLIRDINQARKSAAGSNFQSLVAYSLALNVFEQNLPELKIAMKPKNHPLIERYATIKIGNETQKPDVDIVIYQDEPDTPIIILSVKTSLRERAGQTYRWKLLLDFATTKCPYVKTSKMCPINRYDIKYEQQRPIIVFFVTADFYDEVNSPQQKGMFTFFDQSYLTSPNIGISNNHVKPFSEIITDIQNIYCR